MKGGKAGRDRKSGDAKSTGPRGGAKKGTAKGAAKGGAPRPTNAPPKKGSRKKPGYGGSSSSGEE